MKKEDMVPHIVQLSRGLLKEIRKHHGCDGMMIEITQVVVGRMIQASWDARQTKHALAGVSKEELEKSRENVEWTIVKAMEMIEPQGG